MLVLTPDQMAAIADAAEAAWPAEACGLLIGRGAAGRHRDRDHRR